MISGLQNISKIPELRNRILFTFGMLAVYRIGIFVPTPGIDTQALGAFFEAQAKGGSLLGLIDMFTGGALSQFSVFALGIMPYISASIIIQLLTVVIPYLERLSKEGDAGRKKITQYTRYGTVGLSIIQGMGIAFGLENMKSPIGDLVVPTPGWGFRIMAVLTLTAGTAFLMWLGERISENGIGNGISMIIFAGIVARFPTAIFNTAQLMRTGEMSIFMMLIIGLVMIAVVGAIILMERGHRKIPVQYAKRVVGRKVYGGSSTHLPLRVNTAGVIPPIFASSLLMFPATIANFHRPPLGPGPGQPPLPRGDLLQHRLHIAHHLFLLLLHGRPVQPRGRGRQHEEIRGVHPGNPSGKAYRRLHRQGLDPDHAWGRAVLVRRLRSPHDLDKPVQRSLLLRRNGPLDRRGCRPGHDDPGGVPHVDPSLRRVLEKGQTERTTGLIFLRPRRQRTNTHSIDSRA